MIHRLEHGKDPEVSICIPTLNGTAERLIQTYCAIQAHTVHLDYEIVVADCEGELRGYTSPQNEAMAAAHGEILVAMNDDVIVTSGWIEALVVALHQEETWCATPDQTHCDGPQIFAPYCMAWHHHAWEEISGLDEQFKWWCSDIDLARRLADVGHLPVRVKLPNSIQHDPGRTATGPHQMELIEMAQQDLDRFAQKWGVTAEQEKYRLAALVCPEYR